VALALEIKEYGDTDSAISHSFAGYRATAAATQDLAQRVLLGCFLLLIEHGVKSF
jgi:hypothetical protein